MEKKYISRKEAAEVFGVHPQTIANWLEKGILLGHVAQGSTFIDIQSIEQLKASFGDIVEAEAKIQQYKVEIKEQHSGEYIPKHWEAAGSMQRGAETTLR